MMAGKTTRVAAIGLVLALAAAACGNASSSGKTSAPSGGSTVTTFSGKNFSTNQPVQAPGVTSTEIHVGSITSKTNPVGGDPDLLNDGINAYFDSINSQGGIYGRKLKLTSTRDDKTVNNQAEAQGLLRLDNVYAAFIATELFTGAKTLAKAGIPTFGWNINPEWAGPTNFFPNRAPVCFQGCPLLPHVTPWLAQQTKGTKVAIIGYSVAQSAGCVNQNVANFKQFGSNVGASVVFSDSSLSFGQTDFNAQVSEMKKRGANFLITCMDFNGDLQVAREMVKQGIRNQVTFYHANLYNKNFVNANRAVFEGDYVLAQITAVEHTPPAPAIQDYLNYASAHGLKVTEMTMQGWIAAQQFVDALKATGPNFTWSNLVAAWNQQTAYTGSGWLIPIDWTKQHTDPAQGTQYQSPYECANFVKIHDGAFVGVFDDGGAKPWVCWPGLQPTVWSAPTQMSFAGPPPYNLGS